VSVNTIPLSARAGNRKFTPLCFTRSARILGPQPQIEAGDAPVLNLELLDDAEEWKVVLARKNGNTAASFYRMTVQPLL
jgi:hypothetical protein